MDVRGEARWIRQKEDIDEIDAIIIPGGESTTISKILSETGMRNAIVQRLKQNNISIMGTCAGCILLAKEIIGGKIKSLNAMDMQVERNALGRQKESFEKNIEIKGFSEPYNAVFIRAPVIRKVWGDCEVIGKLDEKIIAARQGKLLALSFHPELTNDLRVHKYFLEMNI
jgi:5'-phosphate synthase pdxT subunit